MLTEKSITQQLRFHKLPFPEDLGRGWATVVLEEIIALFKKVGLQPSSEQGSSCLSPGGRGSERGPWERRRESPGEKGLVPTRPYYADQCGMLCRRMEIKPHHSLKKGEEVGEEPLTEVPALF